ncbi:hypothetical protein BH11MYX3_BH11MYX3_47540 [soil metagenome]
MATALLIAGCGAGETRIDPGDLELRDLLGVAPEVAVTWDPAQRAAARRVLIDGFRERAQALPLASTEGDTIDDRVTRAMAALDAARAADGDGALGLVRLTVGRHEVTALSRVGERAAAVADGGPAPVTELWLAEEWDAHAWNYLPGRGLDVLSAIAVDAGHQSGPLVVAPSSRLGVIAGYVTTESPPRLVINPIVLAALDPDANEVATVAGMVRPAAQSTASRIAFAEPSSTAPHRAPILEPVTAEQASANPYSFYGSVAECAYAQRTRCEACVAAGNCLAVTDTSDGNAECTTLGENNGRGYFLLCANLSLAISSVEDCTKDGAPSCPRSTNAASSLSTLDANANFVDDPSCGDALDGCLAKIYGAPPDAFPSLDGGLVPPRPARDTSVDCGEGCSSSNNNCDASPSCNCDGPSCNNSFSCDSACSSSNDQSGCGGNCDSCNSSSSGGGGGGGCSSGSGSSSSGDSCSGGSCGGSGGSCGSSGGGCGGGSSSKSCSAAPADPSAGAALAISLLWALMPVPVAAVVRRRSRKRKAAPLTPEVPVTEEEAP